VLLASPRTGTMHSIAGNGGSLDLSQPERRGQRRRSVFLDGKEKQ
jgi:hypothetical protein